LEPLAVDLKLLRQVLAPELRLLPGRALMARVMVAGPPGRGTLNIAGITLTAELPKDVKAGQELRLVVREVTPERVVLSLADSSQPPSAAEAIPLPGGGQLRVTERPPSESGRDQHGARAGGHTLALRYDAPALGAVDLGFQLDDGALRVTIALAPGQPLELARARADTLRTALGAELDRAVSVTVVPRRQPLDLYA
jgi:hypothetical protein